MINRLCEICGKSQAEHKHHKFSQTKINRKLYPEFIDKKENIVYACSMCHLNKSMPKWNEIEFCEYFNIKPRSKSCSLKSF
jgi:hypothetical protein